MSFDCIATSGLLLVFAGCQAAPVPGRVVADRPGVPRSIVPVPRLPDAPGMAISEGEPEPVGDSVTASDASLMQPAVQDLATVPQARQRSSFYYGLEEHRQNYFSFASFNSSPDRDGEEVIEEFEWTFQISIRRDFYEWESAADRVTLAYTNRTFWQVTQSSSPFRTSDHEPELFYEHDWNENIRLQVGVSHQSNGQGGIRSRSWDRVFGQIIGHSKEWYEHVEPSESATWRWSVKPWAVLRRSRLNPDIEDYMGRAEIGGDIAWGAIDSRPRLSIRLRNNLDFSDNRNALEVAFSYGVAPGIRVFAQYFNGHGENLVDAMDYSNRFSVGFELSRAQ